MITFKDLKIDPDMYCCYQGRKELDLTKYELGVLQFLLENPDKLHTRQEISKEVWKEENTNIRKVDAIVSKLRKKLDGQYIISKYGVGYGMKSE